MKNSKRLAVLAAALVCFAASALTQPASARNDAWKAANQWAVGTWMAQHGGYWPGAGYGGGYPYNNNYYNPYSSYYNGYNPYYNPYMGYNSSYNNGYYGWY